MRKKKFVKKQSVRAMLLTTVAILLTCADSGLAQTPGSNQNPKRKTKVAAAYDQSKNETELRTQAMVLWKPLPISGQLNFERVAMALSFSYSGKKIATPQSVVITIFSERYSTGRFAKQRDLSFTTEAQQYQFGEMELGQSWSTYVPDSSGESSLLVTERVRKFIPFADFVQIAQATKVKMKIGDSTFKLEKEHLEVFRNFVTLMREEGLEF